MLQDSNLWPPARQAGTLASWAKHPFFGTLKVYLVLFCLTICSFSYLQTSLLTNCKQNYEFIFKILLLQNSLFYRKSSLLLIFARRKFLWKSKYLGHFTSTCTKTVRIVCSCTQNRRNYEKYEHIVNELWYICFIRSTQSFGEVKYEKDWKDQKGFYPRRDGTGNCHHRNLDRSSCYRYRFIP